LPSVRLGYRTVRLPVTGVEHFIDKRNAISPDTKGGRYWIERGVYHHDELVLAYSKLQSFIQENGDTPAACRLQVETEKGKIYTAEILLP